ncbi:hypothetical protein [Sphingomonas prati]|uniref:Uncharacterized protein n=1 Tax=Sphingomonas prati TaxID=1843237 RepID=A0A7W9BRT7_9SPHN|nr:hypothetical protein [Sphingomonas prati]MBB5728423.1 hypothetical protein [Sphingomonas prati]GGE73934.1 hypothetical protein GCM10011404_03030 [Sphingomonas prati]
MSFIKMKLVDEDRYRTYNLNQVLWWEGFGDEVEITFTGTGPIRVRVSHYEMEMLTNSLPRTVGE